MQGYGFNLNSWFRSNDGILFVGGINGLNYLRPENFTLDNGKLRVFIEEVKSSKSDTVFYALDQKARLSYSDRSIEVRFASPYFNNPEKVSYRYKIEGLDDDWNYAGNNPNLRLTSLPPGHYKLRLEATLNQADWIPSANVFEFRIRPPFWLTPWFITLVAAVLCLLTWLLIRNRNQKIREKQEELEAEQMIHYFSTGMDDQHSVDMILWEVARNCIGRLQFEDCVIYLYDEERKMLVQKAAHGPKSPKEFDIKSPIEIPLGKGITGSVALHGKAELVGDTSKDPRYIVDDEVRLSEIAVPMMSGGKLIGVIDCEHTRKGFFTKKHLTMLSTIASICANKIVKLQTEQEHRAIEQKLMATRQKMVEVEMQALRAQMNPHFIFNCLNSINRYIVKSDQATASLYLTRFAKLIRLILDNSNSQAVTLSSEMEALKLYIEMELIRFEKQFSYSIEVDEDVAADSIYVPPLIIQPYVENAIWHGLLHKEETGNLTIRLKLSKPGLLECFIEDNGVGRARAKELRSKSASTKKSLGMKLTQDRLQLLSREGESGLPVIEIEDLYHEDGSAAGTRVVLRIPV
ncbi:MAG: histidine kinase [Chitinophagaceae bacterium]|nr:histidine kinase [Chitinophagaceae bacterium]